MDNFITNWNSRFSDYQLKTSDLKEPQVLMGALLKIFDGLGIDRAILAESPEDSINDSMQYYRDLLPVINVTRVVNYLLSMMPQMLRKISIMDLLKPNMAKSHCILLLLFNLMAFYEEKLQDIGPYEQELFQESEQVKKLEERNHKLKELLNQRAQDKALRAERLEQVKKLEERNHKLKELLNQRAQDKALRAERLEQLDATTEQLEEELKEEMAACNATQAELDELNKQHRAHLGTLALRRGQLDAAHQAADKKRALRVLDADDVTAQAEQATRDVAELDEKLAASRAKLIQKEDSLKNLQAVKPALDAAANLLRDVARLSDTIMELKCGDLDCDSQVCEGELTVLQTQLADLQAASRELQAARLDTQAAAQAARTRRHHDQAAAHSALREASEKSKKNEETIKDAKRRTTEIEALTLQYEEEKARGMQDITDIHNDFDDRLRSCENMLKSQMKELARKVENKQNKQNNK